MGREIWGYCKFQWHGQSLTPANVGAILRVFVPKEAKRLQNPTGEFPADRKS